MVAMIVVRLKPDHAYMSQNRPLYLLCLPTARYGLATGRRCNNRRHATVALLESGKLGCLGGAVNKNEGGLKFEVLGTPRNLAPYKTRYKTTSPSVMY